MRYPEIKAKVLESSVNKLIDISKEKFGVMWLYNKAFWNSKERVLLRRYADMLVTLNETPHHITDTCHE